MLRSYLFVAAVLAPLFVHGSPQRDATAWRSPGKLTAPVELAVARRYEAQVGETFGVALNLSAHAAASAVRVEVNADDGLLLDKPLLRFDLGAVEAGEIDVATVQVSALRDGRASLNVSVYMDLAAGARVRHFSIPVAVGDVQSAARKRTDIRRDASGRPVRVLPGVETN